MVSSINPINRIKLTGRNGSRPRILLIADVPHWIFHRHAKMIDRYLRDEFDFDLLFKRDLFNEDDYDLIYPLEYNLVPAERIRRPSKYVTGIRSFKVLWHDDSELPALVQHLQDHFQQVHAVSRRLFEYFQPYLPNLLYLTHGVDTTFFTPATSSDISGKKLRLGWAGNRRNPQKGFDQFIKPLENLEGVELVHYGYIDHNLGMEEMPAFYNSIDAYICASENNEGNNNPLMEASSMERAIITTDTGTVSEYLQDQVSALIVERKLESFVQAVEYLRDHPEVRVRLGQAARKSVLNGWDWKVRAEEHRLFFQNALRNAESHLAGLPSRAGQSGGAILKHKVFPSTEMLALSGLAKLDKFIQFLAERFHCSTILLIKDLKSLDVFMEIKPDTIAVITDAGFLLDTSAHAAGLIGRLISQVQLVLLFDNTSLFIDEGRLKEFFTGWDVQIEHVGCLTNEFNRRVGRLALISSHQMTFSRHTPDDFRVVAVIASYNEEDILVPAIQHLISQGVDVYLIDNWSTDQTYQKAQSLLGKGVIGLERFPQNGPSSTYEWAEILKRKEQVCREVQADWFLHHDVDEIRESPWQGVSLRDAIFQVDQQGYNAIDFTVINFLPVDDQYSAETSLRDHFKYFEFVKTPGSFVQIRGWKKTSEAINLHASGGHSVEFSDRRIYPYKFLLRHYPIRSQSHGERKIFKERQERYSTVEKQANWHGQYDAYGVGANFLKDPAALLEFRTDFHADYLIERLSGVGILPVAGNTEEEIVEQVFRKYLDQIAALNHALGEVNQELQEIKISKAWRGVLLLRQMRIMLVPVASRRERLFQKILNFMRSFFHLIRK